MTEPSNDVLLEKINNLHEKIEEGFKGTHARLDLTNGNVKRNTEFRLRFQGSLSTFKWLFGALGIGNIIMFVKILIL